MRGCRVSIVGVALVIGTVSAGCQQTDTPATGEPRVTARHAIASPARANAVHLVSLDTAIELRWTSSGSSRVARSADGGMTFGSPSTDETRMTPTGALRVSPTADAGVWHIEDPGGDASAPWAVALPSLIPLARPVAVSEPTGTTVLVTVETRQTSAVVMLQRYVRAPRIAPGAPAMRVAWPIEIGRPTGAPGQPAVTVVPGAAVVAWAESDAVRVVRVDLPPVLCRHPLGSVL
ncbi:MAG: hypothetical protein IT182_15955 [Acidobacteria bacterium]|nr:hypothetical protein [Acidobacteriota bacterium]